MKSEKDVKKSGPCVTRKMTEAEKYKLDLKLKILEEADRRREEVRMNYLRWRDGQTYNVRI